MSINWVTKKGDICIQITYKSALRALSSDSYCATTLKSTASERNSESKEAQRLSLCQLTAHMEAIDSGWGTRLPCFCRMYPLMMELTMYEAKSKQSMPSSSLIFHIYLYIKQWKIQKLKQVMISKQRVL